MGNLVHRRASPAVVGDTNPVWSDKVKVEAVRAVMPLFQPVEGGDKFQGGMELVSPFEVLGLV